MEEPKQSTRKERIDDSLELCRDIYRYYKKRPDSAPPAHTGQAHTRPARAAVSLLSEPYSGGNPEAGIPAGKSEERSRSRRQPGRGRKATEAGTDAPALLPDPEQDDAVPENEEFSASEAWKNILYLFLCVMAAFLLAKGLNHFIVQQTSVDGVSMENTLHDGDHLLIDKLSYRLHAPERFDIVIFPFDDNTYYIKRVIGLPGETVQIRDGIVLIDGEPLAGDIYGKEKITEPGLAGEEILLGEKEYFVLGDNRNNSLDSRYETVGNITEEHLIGKAFLRIYPFNRISLFQKGRTED